MAKNLITGGPNDPFLPKIIEAIHNGNEIELAVAFIKSSGLELLFPSLAEAITNRGSKLTILTSDYLDVTDPQALRRLMLLSERGADIRVFQTEGNQSFHLKAYIFIKTSNGIALDGAAFIGSSNISKIALTDGLEWNYKVHLSSDDQSHDTQYFHEIRDEYQKLIYNTQVRSLDYNWIDAYEKRRKVDRLPVAPGSNDPELPTPEPNEVQRDALEALKKTRGEGFQRGLVVMATGLGKTYLAAFDSEMINAKRVLFVAHREEILLQAEATFQRVHPRAKVGHYTGSQKEMEADMLFASVQTLGKNRHLKKFSPNHFDYLVIDEFHHAAAPTYRKLLAHFHPRFMLGLTATPERTDQSDILSLCDDNLVFDRNLFYGVEQEFLCPFTYFGIYDESVNYKEIPWRNGNFHPTSLSNKLATIARAKHALTQWREKAQSKTLAFCVSRKHAQFMADRFQREGIRAAAVYGGSHMARDEALEQLNSGQLQIIFSVDLFNEGVDLPAIDTVLMLRPTESKVLFLQQLGRGLRKNTDKERLVVLDFIGNHQGFLNKPQALFGVRGNNRDLADFGRKVKAGSLELPPECYVSYDLEVIDFLIGLAGDGPSHDYRILRDSLGRRPTLSEYYRSGSSLQGLRKQYGQWWKLVLDEGDLQPNEIVCVQAHEAFLREVESTHMTKSFKAVLLETLLEHDGFQNPPTIEFLASQALNVFKRRRRFISDIREDLQDVDQINEKKWLTYWKGNPINAWIGGNRKQGARVWFGISDGRFVPTFSINENLLEDFNSMVQELIDYRLAAYEPRLKSGQSETDPIGVYDLHGTSLEIPFFTDLRIACGHFREGEIEADEYRNIGKKHSKLDPGRHFIASAVGDSMDGGENPVHNGDYLLLERLDSNKIENYSGATIVVERSDDQGNNQYLLRVASEDPNGGTTLKANNPTYPAFIADKSMTPLARLRAIIDPLELSIGKQFMRENIAGLFGVTFNPGNWNSGHVVLNEKNAHILLVTINKQGMSSDQRYHDYFLDDSRFHWQSQSKTTPESKRGAELISHESKGISVHLFVRENKLAGGKAAPFKYCGPLRYQSHRGTQPISITWEVLENSHGFQL